MKDDFLDKYPWVCAFIAVAVFAAFILALPWFFAFVEISFSYAKVWADSANAGISR